MEGYETRKPKIHNEGIWGTHDMPCAVCHKEAAVMCCQSEVFSPCWKCQKEGWDMRKLNRFCQWLLKLTD